MKLFTSISFLALMCVGMGQSIPRFLPSTRYPVPGASMAVLADVNGDGKLDVVTANGYAPNPEIPGSGGHGVSVMLGNGNGTFQSALSVSTTGNPNYVVVKDFDGDGKADLMVDDGPGTNTISFYKGTGTGTFQAPIKTVINSAPVEGLFNLHGIGMLVSADFNHDGLPDLAISYVVETPVTVGAVITPMVKVLLNNGNGTFRTTFSATTDYGLTGTAVQAADFNGDGIPDLLIYGEANTVELGNGDGTFRQDPTNPYNTIAAGVESVFADFDRDGLLDTASIGATPPRAGLTYFINLGLGGSDSLFTTTLPGFFAANSSSYVAADFNGDGLLDVAGSNTVFYNLGNGQFQPLFKAVDFGAGNSSLPAGELFPQQWYVAGDLDGNGSPDLISTQNGTWVEVALNTGGNPPLLASLASNSSAVVTGTVVTETVSVGSKAPAGGAVVSLASSNASGAVPASVTIPAGAESATFPVSTSTGVSAMQVMISATYRGVTLRNNILVVPHFTLSSLTVAPSTLFGMLGGNPAVGTISLSGLASDGVVVTLTSSNSSALTVPVSATVPAGTTSVTFPLSAQFVNADTPVTVSATFQGVTKTVPVTVKKEVGNITITKAEYAVNKKLLNVEGTTTSASTRFSVYDKTTGVLVGLVSVIRGKFTGQLFSPALTPVTSIVVQSTLGEAATSAVAQK